MYKLTPNNGGQAQPYTSDYTKASFGNFTFQVALQDLTPAQAQSLYGALISPQFKAGLNKAYTGTRVVPL